MTRRARSTTRRRRASKRRARGGAKVRVLLPAPACAALQAAYPVPFGGLGFGVSPDAKRLRVVTLHLQTGYCVDAANGLVYGRSGEPIGGVCADGYVRLKGGPGMPQTVYAHRLVWEVANGPIPDGMQIDHKNAQRADNRARNLQAVTQADNNRLVFKRGGGKRGEGVATAKLTEARVREIRRNPHLSGNHYAALFGVSRGSVNAARRGRTWRHVRQRGRPAGSRGSTN